MHHKIAAIAVGLVMMITAGCSSISSGIITAKTFTPAHNGSRTWCHKVGKIMMCQPMPTHYNDRWTFTLQNGDAKGDVDVSREIYDEYKVGDHYSSAK